MTSGEIFSALGDPTRREVAQLLARSGPMSATELARDLPVTRQAVAKHLAVLRDAGLVDAERTGREVRFRFVPLPLGEAARWLAEVGGAWDERLRGLAAVVEAAGDEPPGGSPATG